jgi:hypothetical protein
MSTDTTNPPLSELEPALRRHHSRLQGAAAALAILVAAVHVVDQGGVPGTKSPAYVAVGYWVLEAVALLVAATLYARNATRALWVIALGVAAGPLIGFVLSRSSGLPGYRDDRGNWGEPLGVVSLVVEALLLVVCLAGAGLAQRTRPRYS